MSGRKKIVLSFITVFILGLVTGVAFAPLIVGRLIGNPYSDDIVARRVFNTNFIETKGMNLGKEKLVDNLVAKYVSQYMVMKDKFNDQRFNLYAGFTNELKNILDEKEYTAFLQQSEQSMKERERYHKEKAGEWVKNRNKSKYYNKDYEEAARLMYAPKIPTDTKTSPMIPKATEYLYSDPDDILQQYLLDKSQNNWDTFQADDVLRDENGEM